MGMQPIEALGGHGLGQSYQNPFQGGAGLTPGVGLPGSWLPGMQGLGQPCFGQNPATDGYQASPESSEEEDNENGEGQQESPVQQLLQQIEMDLAQLQTDQASGNNSAVAQDEQQLGQDLQALQTLEGGAAPSSAMPAADPSSDGGDDAGSGGAPASSGAPASGGSSGGGSAPSSSSTGGAAPASGSSQTYDGASGSATPQSVQQNAQIVAQVAQQKGVDPVTAVATMLVESGGNNQAVGDNGTSFGLFQLHQGGELGNMTQQQAEDPTTNANTALSQFASVQQSTGLTGGALAAAAQRPADPTAYAAQVNSKMAEAKQLLGQG